MKKKIKHKSTKKAKITKSKALKLILKFVVPLFVLLYILFILLAVPGIEIVRGDPILLGAHRGNSVDYIENTLPAFQSAVEEDKYKFIEFDVQYTRDKEMVVFHDDSLLRLQKKNYKVKDLTYEELLEVSDYHIPTYEEVIDIIAGEKPLSIEIKSQYNLTDDQIMIDYIIADCRERGILNTTMISSISSDAIKYSKEAYPEVETGKIYYISPSTFLHFDYFTREFINEIENSNYDYLLLHGSNLRNYNSIKKILPKEKTLIIWYFNDEVYVIDSKDYFGGKVYSFLPKWKFWEKKTKTTELEEPCYWFCE